MEILRQIAHANGRIRNEGAAENVVRGDRFACHYRIAKTIGNLGQSNPFGISPEHSRRRVGRSAAASTSAKIVSLAKPIRGDRRLIWTKPASIDMRWPHTPRVTQHQELAGIISPCVASIVENGIAGSQIRRTKIRRHNHEAGVGIGVIIQRPIVVKRVVLCLAFQRRKNQLRPSGAIHLPIIRARRKRFLRFVIHMQCQADLLEVIRALRAPGGFSRSL